MAIKHINIGAAANDKTGTPARQAGQIINENFDYLENKVLNVNTVITPGLSVLVGQNLTIKAGWVWKINGQQFSNPADVVINFPYAATGKRRFDRIVFNTSNTFTKVVGTESVSNPVAMPVPVDTIDFGVSLVTDSSVGQNIPPGDLGEKLDKGGYVGTAQTLKNDVDSGLLLKENKANKATDFSVVNDELYPTIKASKTYTDNVVATKLDKNNAITTNPQAYIKKADGTQTMFDIENVLSGSANKLADGASVKTYVDEGLSVKEDLSNKAVDYTIVNDELYPTVKASKTYTDNLVVGMLNLIGSYDASLNLYPTTGGSGTAGAIRKGDLWYVSVAGTLSGKAVNVGDSFVALSDAPGQIFANWNVMESNIGYVPANDANVFKLTGDQAGSGIKRFSQNAVFGNDKIPGILPEYHLTEFNAPDDITPIAISGGTGVIEYWKETEAPSYAWAAGLRNPSVPLEEKDSFKFSVSIDAAPFSDVLEISNEGNLYTKGVLSEKITILTPTISGQPAIIKYVNSLNTTQPVKLVIYFHGAGTNQLNPFTDDSKIVIDVLLSQGYIVAHSQAHGDNWGSQTAQNDYLALYNYIASTYNLSDVIFVGHSMGGLASLTMIAKNTIPAVTKWYGIFPVTNLYEAYYTEGFSSPIEAAYGFTGSTNYATGTAGNDPNLYSGSAYTNRKYAMTASSGDTVISKTTNSDLINSKLTGIGIYSYIVSATGNHGNLSHFIPKHVSSFVYDGIDTNKAIVSNGINVGIGTGLSLPIKKLTVEDIDNQFALKARSAGNPTYQSWYTSAGLRRGYFGFPSQGSSEFRLVNEESGGNISINTTSGNVLLNSLSGSTTRQVVALADGTLSATDIAPTSGIYTPTKTPIANCSSVNGIIVYTRVGNIVSGTLRFSLTETATNTQTRFSVTLPVNRTSSSASNAIGSGAIQDAFNQTIYAQFESTNNSMSVTYNTLSSFGNRSGVVSFQYSVLE